MFQGVTTLIASVVQSALGERALRDAFAFLFWGSELLSAQQQVTSATSTMLRRMMPPQPMAMHGAGPNSKHLVRPFSTAVPTTISAEIGV